MMNSSLTEDLWATILSRLPLKSLTTSKSVCKQWKSLIESPFLRELFSSHHQTSHSSWSFMYKKSQKEVVAHYGCEIWGLQRSLGSYISSFLTEDFLTVKETCELVWFRKPEVRIVAYTDVGFILISKKSISGNQTYHVANPISRQCVALPPPPPNGPPTETFRACGLATRIQNGVVSGYKVVLLMVNDDNTRNNETSVISFLVYSSETGQWSFTNLYSPFPLRSVNWFNPFSLNGVFHWIGYKSDSKQVVVSHDFFAESDRCSVVLFPDLEKKQNFKRTCTTSQGYLMYTNLCKDKNESGLEDKLSVWRLLKTGKWELVSEITPACIKSGFDYFPLAINPSDANTMYLWSKLYKCLVSTNVHKGKFGLHKNLERYSNGRVLKIARKWSPMAGGLSESSFSTFVLPRWLYRIPSSPHCEDTSLA